MGAIVLSGALLRASAAIPAFDRRPIVGPPTRYVDPAAGDDAADGLTPETAWRHCPGETGATHAPGVTLVPGDHVAFKGGTEMTGGIGLPPPGLPHLPIVFSGNRWGDGRCAIQGALPVSTRAAASKADAGGHDGWASLMIAEWPPDGHDTRLFDELGTMPVAQYPRAQDPIQFDMAKRDGYRFPLDDTALSDLHAGGDQIEDSSLAAHLAGEAGRARLWVNRFPNVYEECPVVSVSGDVVAIAKPSGGWAGLPELAWNQGIFAMHCVADVARPGDWCLLEPGKALYLPRDGGGAVRRAVAAAKTRTIRHNSWCWVTGFDIRNFACDDSDQAIWRPLGGAEGAALFDNRIRDVAPLGSVSINFLKGTQAPWFLFGWNRATRFGPMCHGFTMEATGQRGLWNVFRQVGGDAFRANASSLQHFMAIVGNICSDMKSDHSNPLTVYGLTANVLVQWNAAFDTPRPLTMQGLSPAAGRPDYRIPGRVVRWNLLVSDEVQANGAWALRVNNHGRQQIGMLIEENMLFAAGAAAGLYRTQPGLRLCGNFLTADHSGSAVPGVDLFGEAGFADETAGWDVSGNQSIAIDWLQTTPGVILEQDHVDVTAPDGRRLHLDLRTVAA